MTANKVDTQSKNRNESEKYLQNMLSQVFVCQLLIFLDCQSLETITQFPYELGLQTKKLIFKVQLKFLLKI